MTAATISSLPTQKREPISAQRIFAFTVALSVHVALLLLLMLGGAVGFRSTPWVEESSRSEVFVVQQSLSQRVPGIDSGAEKASVKTDQLQTKSDTSAVLHKPIKQNEQVLTSPTIVPDGDTVIGQSAIGVSDVPAEDSSEARAANSGNGDVGAGLSGEGRSTGINGLDTLLAIVSPAPQYPVASLRNGEQGEVIVLIRVGVDGKPISAEVVQSSGHTRLDQAMLRHVLAKWRYQPAIKNGRAVEAYVLAKQKFVLGGVYPDS